MVRWVRRPRSGVPRNVTAEKMVVVVSGEERVLLINGGVEAQDVESKLWMLGDSLGQSQFISSTSAFRVTTKSEYDVEEEKKKIPGDLGQSLYLEGCKKQHGVLALKLRNPFYKLIVSWGCTHGKRRKSVGLHHTTLRRRKSRAKYVHLIKTTRVRDQGQKTKGADASHHKSRGCLVLRSHGHCFGFQQLVFGAMLHDSGAKVKLDIIFSCRHSLASITSESRSTWNGVWSDPLQLCGVSSSSIQSTLEQTTRETAAFQQTSAYNRATGASAIHRQTDHVCKSKCKRVKENAMA